MENIVLSLFALVPLALIAHPGGLDKKGGHIDKKTSQYHIHKKQEADKATDVKTPEQKQAAAETDAAK